jgi:phenylalanyl-tRNA synthetase beta chain
MKVSVNSVKQFLDFKLPSTNELVGKIGAQLAAVDDVIDVGIKYNGIPIVRIVSCVPHPNADRLKICLIDDGNSAQGVDRDENGHVQVVCGAPNAREGITVVWLPPGVVVPETADKDPFTLEARELRGVVSNGMLASPKELGLSDSHEGILEIDEEVAPGTLFTDKYNLHGDVVIDMENKMFTHRPDLFGFLGIARELAGIHQQPFKSPDWYVTNPEFPSYETSLPITIHNELPELVPRFAAITLSDITVGPSPVWLQIELAKLGLRPINNIVDLTNYYMVLTGQPLHAYDYDKVKALSDGDSATIVVRYPYEGEKITLLNDKEIEPRKEAIMIATNQKVIGVGGVMGGSETEVDENTKNIILECATFDMYSIRRTSMQHGLFTDAVTRFNKGQSPLQNLAVLRKIIQDIQACAGGKIASQLQDSTHTGTSSRTVHVASKFINDRLGLKLTSHEIKNLLENVELTVEESEDNLIVESPFWRTDIEIPEDIVEEVGRLYGYDHLPLDLPIRSVKPVQKDVLFETKAIVRERLSKAGANEVLTYSFVHSDLLKKVGQEPAQAFQLSNALSPDLQYYRMSLMPSLLEKVHSNIKAGYEEFALFELGKTHSLDQVDENGLPNEFEITSLVVVAHDRQKKTGASYYQAQRFLVSLVGVELAFKPVPDTMTKYAVTQPYDLNRTAFVYLKGSDEFLGIVGEFKASVARQLKLPKYCAGFEVDTEVLQRLFSEHTNTYVALPRFPKVTHDITLRVPSAVPYSKLCDTVTSAVIANAPNTHRTISTLDIYQKEDDRDHKQITYRITLGHYEKTMRDEEVNKILEAVTATAKQAVEAERV